MSLTFTRLRVTVCVMRYYNSVPLYRGYAGNGSF